MTDQIAIEITANKATQVPLLFRKGTPVKAGVYGRPVPIGWSRLYMHLWSQAVAQGVKASRTSGDTDADARERWVVDALKKLAGYSPQALPHRLSYDDAVSLLQVAKAFRAPFIPFNPSLYYKDDGDDGLAADALRQKREEKETWFRTASKYAKIFADAGAPGEYWWSPIASETVPFGRDNGPGRAESAPVGQAASVFDRINQYLMLDEDARLKRARGLWAEVKACIQPTSDKSDDQIKDAIYAAEIALAQLAPTGSPSFEDKEMATLIVAQSPILYPELAQSGAILSTAALGLLRAYLKATLGTNAADLKSAEDRLDAKVRAVTVTFVPPSLGSLLDLAEGMAKYRDGVCLFSGRLGQEDGASIIIWPSGDAIDPQVAYTATGLGRAAGIKLLHTVVHEWVHTITTANEFTPWLHRFGEAMVSIIATDVLRGDARLAMTTADEPTDLYDGPVKSITGRFDRLETLQPGVRAERIKQYLNGSTPEEVFRWLNFYLKGHALPELSRGDFEPPR